MTVKTRSKSETAKRTRDFQNIFKTTTMVSKMAKKTFKDVLYHLGT